MNKRTRGIRKEHNAQSKGTYVNLRRFTSVVDSDRVHQRDEGDSDRERFHISKLERAKCAEKTELSVGEYVTSDDETEEGKLEVERPEMSLLSVAKATKRA